MMSIAMLLETKSHCIPGKLRVSELFFEVPKDYSNLSLGTLLVFARSVTKEERPAVPPGDEELRKKAQKPWFVFLNGGPGLGCQSPQAMPMTDIVLERGYQILYLDQRGTGLSTPITAATLTIQGDIQRQADYLKLFRADSIVKDCEAIRKNLTRDYPSTLQKWSIFGQSFGGFCALNYLSKFPQGLREVFTAGGIPPVGISAEDVYTATFAQVIKRNEAYYEKFPEDIEFIHDLAVYIQNKGDIPLPGGGTLTAPRFLTLGMCFGFHGGLDTVHETILRMRSDLKQFGFITRPALSGFERLVPFDDAVLYAVLHESIYCHGEASNWAAYRAAKSFREFHWIHEFPSAASTVRQEPLYFSGEMIFPSMFQTHPELMKLKEVAETIAQYRDWPNLYDEAQLARNEVPIYAATFIDDMYVDFGLVQDTLKKVKNCKQYITNVLYHDAVRSKSYHVLNALFALRDDSID